jgi:hypothetical protein
LPDLGLTMRELALSFWLAVVPFLSHAATNINDTNAYGRV